MKCPICGEELRPGKKDPNYLLCYDCKKKFKAPQGKESDSDRTEEPRPRKKRADDQREKERRPEAKKSRHRGEQTYSNIPPKEVRAKREREMRQAYDDMLAIEDDEPSKLPIVILAIAIMIVAALIVYLLFM